MSLIKDRFEYLAKHNKPALVTYIAASDRAPNETVPLLNDLVNAGTDIIELGVPFSDPIADGPVIQAAYERALSYNINLEMVLEMVSDFRANNKETPLVLMGYQNPIETMGIKKFAQTAKKVGVDGVLTVDLSAEEAAETIAILNEYGIDPIFLISPTTPEARVAEICKIAQGFIYYVSLKGITGAEHLNTQDVGDHLAMIRHHTKLPICAGFGIKTPQTATAVADVADGVVVGSTLVEIIGQQGVDFAERRKQVAEVVMALREAIDIQETIAPAQTQAVNR